MTYIPDAGIEFEAWCETINGYGLSDDLQILLHKRREPWEREKEFRFAVRLNSLIFDYLPKNRRDKSCEYTTGSHRLHDKLINPKIILEKHYIAQEPILIPQSDIRRLHLIQ